MPTICGCWLCPPSTNSVIESKYEFEPFLLRQIVTNCFFLASVGGDPPTQPWRCVYGRWAILSYSYCFAIHCKSGTFKAHGSLYWWYLPNSIKHLIVDKSDGFLCGREWNSCVWTPLDMPRVMVNKVVKVQSYSCKIAIGRSCISSFELCFNQKAKL